MLRDDQHFTLRSVLPDQPARFKSAHPWHTKIEHHDIGYELPRLIHRFHSINRFIDDFPPRVRAEQILQATPYQRG